MPPANLAAPLPQHNNLKTQSLFFSFVSKLKIAQISHRNLTNMCISVFLWQAHPHYPLILLLNRDEYHDRPTEALGWWEGGEILGGRDVLAGGTWLGSTRNGRLAFLTNVRELKSVPQAKTRGDLVVRFLESKKNPREFAEELLKEADHYNGFNLIIADLCSMNMVYLTNRPEEGSLHITTVSPGVHVLSNASLDSPWHKCQKLQHMFMDLLDVYGEGDISLKDMVEKLMRDTVKAEKSLLPNIYPVEWEYLLSSIFIDTEESPKGRYGTRSTSALSVKTGGEVTFYETHLEDNLWREYSAAYTMERTQ